MAGDSRKAYILATAANFFGISTSDGELSASNTNQALNNFLDDGNCNTLCATYDGKRVDLSQTVSVHVKFIKITYLVAIVV